MRMHICIYVISDYVYKWENLMVSGSRHLVGALLEEFVEIMFDRARRSNKFKQYIVVLLLI